MERNAQQELSFEDFYEDGKFDTNKAITKIIKNPRYLDLIDSEGFNVMSFAVIENSLNLLKFLWGEEVNGEKLAPEKLPKINAVNKYGQSALDLAIEYGIDPEIINLLHTQGARKMYNPGKMPTILEDEDEENEAAVQLVSSKKSLAIG